MEPLKRLKAELAPILDELGRLLPTIIEQKAGIDASLNSVELLQKIFEIEKLIYIEINRLVHPIQISAFSKPLLHGERLDKKEMAACIARAKSTYVTNLELSHQLILFLAQINQVFTTDILEICHSYLPIVTAVVDRICCDVSHDCRFHFAQTAQLPVLRKAKEIIALLLAKSSFIHTGYIVLDSLKTALESFPREDTYHKEGGCIALQIMPESHSYPFTVVPISTNNEEDALNVSATHPFTEHDRGKGCASYFEIPFWLDSGEESSLELLKKYTVDSILDRVTMGTFCLDREMNLIYSPACIDVMHEFIHILHALKGESLSKVSIPGYDKATFIRAWSDLEEYWTIEKIDGIPFSQNAMSQEITPRFLRFGHEGMCVDQLIPEAIALVPVSSDPFAKDTL